MIFSFTARSIRFSNFDVGLPRPVGTEYRLVQLCKAFLQRVRNFGAVQLNFHLDLFLPEFGAKLGNPYGLLLSFGGPSPALGKLCLQHGYARFARL